MKKMFFSNQTKERIGIMKKFFLLLMAVCICVAMGDFASCSVAKAAEADKEYKIMVNRAANCVTVYKKDAMGAYTVPVRAFVCSCGRAGHATPLGTYRTSDYYDWRLMVDGTYGRYAIRFNRGIMFHSVPYYTRNAADMEWDQYNKLGEMASLGCVRLATDDVKWIYENCPPGTEVVVYDDAANPGPLGKPSEMKLTADNPFKTWDPTNFDAENPWNTVRPGIVLLDNRGDGVVYLPVGSTEADAYSKLAVCNSTGAIYQPGEYEIEIWGNYDLNTAGVYIVRVNGTDFLGMRTAQDMIFCVYNPIAI